MTSSMVTASSPRTGWRRPRLRGLRRWRAARPSASQRSPRATHRHAARDARRPCQPPSSPPPVSMPLTEFDHDLPPAAAALIHHAAPLIRRSPLRRTCVNTVATRGRRKKTRLVGGSYFRTNSASHSCCSAPPRFFLDSVKRLSRTQSVGVPRDTCWSTQCPRLPLVATVFTHVRRNGDLRISGAAW